MIKQLITFQRTFRTTNDEVVNYILFIKFDRLLVCMINRPKTNSLNFIKKKNMVNYMDQINNS